MAEEPVIEKTYTQSELDALLARKIGEDKREWASKVSSAEKKTKELEEKYAELEAAKSAQSVEELKIQLKTKEDKFRLREQELIKTHEETVSKWNKDKINGTYAALVGDKISFERDLAIEHLVNHSLLNDEGEIVYKDPKTGEHVPALEAVEQFAKARPALSAGPQSGTGLRPGMAPRKPSSKPKAEWTSADYFNEVEKELEKK